MTIELNEKQYLNVYEWLAYALECHTYIGTDVPVLKLLVGVLDEHRAIHKPFAPKYTTDLPGHRSESLDELTKRVAKMGRSLFEMQLTLAEVMQFLIRDVHLEFNGRQHPLQASLNLLYSDARTYVEPSKGKQ